MKSVTPIYFCISDTSNSLAISSRSFIKLSMLEDFRANVLKPIKWKMRLENAFGWSYQITIKQNGWPSCFFWLQIIFL